MLKMLRSILKKFQKRKLEDIDYTEIDLNLLDQEKKFTRNTRAFK